MTKARIFITISCIIALLAMLVSWLIQVDLPAPYLPSVAQAAMIPPESGIHDTTGWGYIATTELTITESEKGCRKSGNVYLDGPDFTGEIPIEQDGKCNRDSLFDALRKAFKAHGLKVAVANKLAHEIARQFTTK